MPKANSPFDPELLDELPAGHATQSGVTDLVGQFAKALLECALHAELTHDLGHAHGEPIGNASGNERKAIAADLRAIYAAPTVEQAERACPLCVRSHEVLEVIEQAGLPLLSEYKQHASLPALMREGFTVVTF